MPQENVLNKANKIDNKIKATKAEIETLKNSGAKKSNSFKENKKLIDTITKMLGSPNKRSYSQSSSIFGRMRGAW
jgi:hypothetical protein